MALPENSIGSKKFIVLQGNWFPPKQNLLIDEWLGVDGTEITRTGIRGEPFTLISQVDVRSLTQADDRLLEYNRLTNEGPQVLKIDGVTVQRMSVQVLNVERISRTSLTASVGGLTSNPQALLVCAWTLIAIED